MQAIECGESWESVVGQLRVHRSIERIDEGELLVRFRFANTGQDAVVRRVIESVPEGVEGASAITTAGGDPRAWRYVGDWIVHEVTIPAQAERTTAYLLEVEDASETTIQSPRVRPVNPDDSVNDLRGTAGDPGSTTAEVTSTDLAIDAATDGFTEVSLPSTAAEPDPGDPDTAILNRLIEALDAEGGGKARSKLQSQLGITPSERARLTYVQSRLDDFAAYVDALERLVDDYGVEVIEQMEAGIEANEARTEALDEMLSDLAIDVNQHRETTDDEFETIRDAVESLDTRVERRLDSLEGSLEELQREVESLHDARREDQQVRARELRRLDETCSTLAETIETLEGDVEEFDDFYARFRAAFADT